MPTLRAEHSSASLSLYRSGLTPALLTQRAAPDRRPYIHPILAPDGVGELTEDQPGHHLWQHGLYVGLNDLNGVGFWTEGLHDHKDRDGTFHPHPLAPPVLLGNRAEWNVTADWRSPAGEPMLTESQRWVLEDHGSSMSLDLEWELRAAVDLRFGAYPYGGLFLRMPWRVENDAVLLTSEGASSPAEAEGKRARWVALSMPIPGRAVGGAGIAILDHPANPEHPTPWRVDDSFGIAPSRCIAGEWRLSRQAATVSRYRVFVYVGGIFPEAVEAEWRKFAVNQANQEIRV